MTAAALLILAAGTRVPAVDEWRVSGRLGSISADTRTIALTPLETVDSTGAAISFNQAGGMKLAFSPWTPVRDRLTGRWLAPQEVKPGDAVAYSVAQQDSRVACWEVWAEADRPTIPTFAPPLTLNPEPDQVSMTKVEVPMVFPLAKKIDFADSYLASRGGGSRRHLGQDLMAPKMTPIIAPFAGKVTLRRPTAPGGHYWMVITNEIGWHATFMHLNNDTPGTDDGKGTDRTAFAPGVHDGGTVYPGQLIGWVGDSGNAETTAPHLHFELWASSAKAVVNAFGSLQKSQRLEKPVPRVLAPMIEPRAGEWRIEGQVRQVEIDRGVITMDSITEWEAGKKPEVTMQPQLRYVFANHEMVRIWSPRGLIPANLSVIRAGDEVLAVGPKPPLGKGLTPTLLVVFKNGF